MREPLTADDRGAASMVSYMLTTAITTILISGLLVAGGTYLHNQQEYAAETGLTTVGNELAETVSELRHLSAGGGNATIQVDLPGRVAGHTYTVQLADGPACDTVAAPPESCLVLDVSGLDVTQTVPLDVQHDAIALESTGPSEFRLDWVGATATAARTGGAGEQLPLRVGIGESIAQERRGGIVAGVTNLPPTNVSFTTDPAYPFRGSPVQFTATATDPDPEDPDNPGLRYRWDFDDDGTYEVNTSSTTVTHSFGNYGPTNVSLQVVDEDNASTWDHENVSISGLRPVSVTRTPISTPADDGTPITGSDVTVRLRNEYASTIRIVGLYLRPESGADRLRARDRCVNVVSTWYGTYCDDFEEYHEIRIDVGNNGAWDSLYDVRGGDMDQDARNQCQGYGRPVPDDGVAIPDVGVSISAVYDFDSGTCLLGSQNRIQAVLGSTDVVRVQFHGVEGLDPSAAFTVGVQYRRDVDGDGDYEVSGIVRRPSNYGGIGP